jgi:hypothetical protein
LGEEEEFWTQRSENLKKVSSGSCWKRKLDSEDIMAGN